MPMPSVLNIVFGSIALLSIALLIWQWLAALRFPLHRRTGDHSFAPAVTLLKPLKGCDAGTEDCLRSWFVQDYTGPTQILFGIAAANDPAGDVVRKLLREFPERDAQLIVCDQSLGANGKVSTLVQLEPQAKHEIVVVSDADVRVPPDFLANAIGPLRHPEVGLVNCFYRLANPTTLAMQCEAIAINADFWSQVLQARSLRPLDFALGAVMITRRRLLDEIGGFKSLVNCLADDFQLGNQIARRGKRVELSTVVVECWDPPAGWRPAWKHQLRWARTIRVSRPRAYFFSVLSNVTLWALLWPLAASGKVIAHMAWPSYGGSGSLTAGLQFAFAVAVGMVFMLMRMVVVYDLLRRLARSPAYADYLWLVPIKDLLQAAIWLGAFTGNRVEWRGEKFKLRRDGTMEKVQPPTH